MKRFYTLITLMAVVALAGFTLSAETWSYDWPITYSNDKPDYANGYYNFGASYDADITSMQRNLGGKAWTLNFDKGTKLTYIATGQAVGSPGAYTSYFSLVSDAFAGKIKSVSVSVRTKIEDAMLTVSVNGEAYQCGGKQSMCYTTSESEPLTFTFVPGSADAQEGTIELYFTIPGAKGNAYVKGIAIEYEASGATVAEPVITPAAGSYDEPFDVTISAADGAEIFYTTDGSNPRGDGLKYTAPFTVAESCTVKAVAKAGEAYSAVVEIKYILRADPELSFDKESFTIELLEEDFALVRNPHNVNPIKFKSSDASVAYADNHGMIYTYKPGKCVVSAIFDGDDNYMPQTISVPVEVIAKEPLAPLTVTPGSGDYKDVIEVKASCTDERAVTIWYHIGDKPAELDDLGILDEFEIWPSTSMTLTVDHSCVITFQAMGENVWSEPVTVSYNIELPLKAAFEAGRSYKAVYHNGFDSADEAGEWDFSNGSSWQLTADAGGYRDVPAFSAINSASVYSLMHGYDDTGETVVASSPVIEVPEDGLVQFYALFNPVWIYHGNLMLYICEDTEDAQPFKIWDAFLTSQEAATDDVKWTQYSVALDNYAGKHVYFAFAYELNYGDDVLIDDFEVLTPDGDGSTVSVAAGTPLTFTDMSTGAPDSWLWSFPGAVTETSDQQNPTVVYTAAGTYDVTLTVSKGAESDTYTRKAYVDVYAVAPTAAIDIPGGVYCSPEASIVVPMNTELTFADASDGCPTSWSWTLPGTDVKTSTDEQVTVKYVEEGMFDIDLEVGNDAGKSATYISGVKAGGESLAWNIAVSENDKLICMEMGWYGNYGGTNWLDMDAFAEAFEAPAVPVEISSVNIYFARTEAISTDAVITVGIAEADADGMPGNVLATSSLPVSQLVDASETYNDPTTFELDKTVEVSDRFFVTVSGFPNESTSEGEDNVAMYVRYRGGNNLNTAYHLLKEMDSDYQPTGEVKWYAQTDDPCSFAIAPKIRFIDGADLIESVGTDTPDAPAEYFNLQGVRVDSRNLAPGIYIVRRGNETSKQYVR
ncbi:MAG: PKD domain-containing protein [Bacteroidales bacterium]|nr:PKD domain-containing protein [Bacteroidales bacterium]